MGYEIKMYVGNLTDPRPEYKQDKENPFKDGSGFPYLKDENGDYVATGRTEQCFFVYAMIDLCKTGYGETPLNNLIDSLHEKAKKENTFAYFYDVDGNTKIIDDEYGDLMYPVPLKIVLEAIKLTAQNDAGYRRFEWAIALLESMKEHEEIHVIFYGH